MRVYLSVGGSIGWVPYVTHWNVYNYDIMFIINNVACVNTVNFFKIHNNAETGVAAVK